MRYWRPEDICTVACPHCGVEIEFWKDEPVRQCSGCRKEVRNPKLDSGCADWCRQASKCLGKSAEAADPSRTENRPPGEGKVR